MTIITIIIYNTIMTQLSDKMHFEALFYLFVLWTIIVIILININLYNIVSYYIF